AVEEVALDERVDVPTEERRGRPGVQADPAIAGAKVVILPVRLWDRDRVGDEVIPAADRVEVIQAGEQDESSEAEGGVRPRYQEGSWCQSARDELLLLLRRHRSRGRNRRELRHTRGLPLVGLARLEPGWSVVRVRMGTDRGHQVLRTWQRRC